MKPLGNSFMDTIEIQITPIAKPRMTRRDSWAKRGCVVKYWAFKDELRRKSKSFKLGDAFDITFVIPFPKSYSKKKRELLDGKEHQVKPDLDNMVKAICDCFCAQDSQIHTINAKKIWGRQGQITIINLR